MLRKMLENETNWERLLPMVIYAYNTSKHRSTNISPYEAFLGRDPPSLIMEDRNLLSTTSTSAKEIRERLSRTWDAIEHIETNAQLKQKIYFDNKINRTCKFAVGQYVLKKAVTKSKISPKWEDGWRIKKIHGKTVEIVKNVKTQTVSIDNIKPDLRGWEDVSNTNPQDWKFPNGPPTVIEDEILPSRRNPERNRRLPERFRDHYIDLPKYGGRDVEYIIP